MLTKCIVPSHLHSPAPAFERGIAEALDQEADFVVQLCMYCVRGCVEPCAARPALGGLGSTGTTCIRDIKVRRVNVKLPTMTHLLSLQAWFTQRCQDGGSAPQHHLHAGGRPCRKFETGI